MCRNRLPVSERTRNQIILVKNQIYCFSDTYNASEYPFFGPPYDFHRGLPTLKIIGIGTFFFFNLDISYALFGLKMSLRHVEQWKGSNSSAEKIVNSYNRFP